MYCESCWLSNQDVLRNAVLIFVIDMAWCKLDSLCYIGSLEPCGISGNGVCCAFGHYSVVHQELISSCFNAFLIHSTLHSVNSCVSFLAHLLYTDPA